MRLVRAKRGADEQTRGLGLVLEPARSLGSLRRPLRGRDAAAAGGAPQGYSVLPQNGASRFFFLLFFCAFFSFFFLLTTGFFAARALISPADVVDLVPWLASEPQSALLQSSSTWLGSAPFASP